MKTLIHLALGSLLSAAPALAALPPDGQADAIYLLSSGILSRGIAKEVCSCHFIYGLDAKTCGEWKHLPPQAFLFIQVTIDESLKEVRVVAEPKPPMALPFTVPSATSKFERDGRYYGCNISWVSP